MCLCVCICVLMYVLGWVCVCTCVYVCVCVYAQGKVYLLMEELSQLLRALVPIQLWCRYFLGEEPTNSYFLEAMLIIIYSLCKVRSPA